MNISAFTQKYKSCIYMSLAFFLVNVLVYLSAIVLKMPFLTIIVLFYEYLFGFIVDILKFGEHASFIGPFLFFLMISVMAFIFLALFQRVRYLWKSDVNIVIKLFVTLVFVGGILFYFPKDGGYKHALDLNIYSIRGPFDIKKCDCLGYSYKQSNAGLYTYDLLCYGVPLHCQTYSN